MKRNVRLSVALHGLVHLAEETGPLRTSEELARCVGTNPVVIRRTFARLREAGLLRSHAGPGGGWRLARPAAEISLGEVCRALGERLLISVDLAAPTGCRLQSAVSSVLDGVIDEAEALLLARLDGVTLVEFIGRAGPRKSSEAHRERTG